MDLDDVLPTVGEFGKYQQLIIWFILLPAVFPCGFHAYNQLFMATVPKHWCNISHLLNVTEQSNFENVSIIDKNSESQCFAKNISQKIPCEAGWIYKDVKTNSVISEWNLFCDREFLVTLALVLFGTSGLVGNYIFGYIQDGCGRKPAYYIYLLIGCIFGIATAFATNYVMWVIFRIGVGFTVPAILGTPYVLAIELVGPSERTLVTILINIAYSLSLISLAIIVWAIRDWRLMALATTLPFLTLFFSWPLLPESPRWLLAQGHFERAETILHTMARLNKKQLPKNFITEYKIQKLQDKFNCKKKVNYGICDLFKTKNLKWKTIIITFIWFTNTSVYVGLSYYAPTLGGDEYLNFFLAGAVELPTYLFLWPAMERLGRRWTLCISMIIGGTSCLATFLVQNDYVTTLILYCVGKMGISSSFVVLPLMASELYPTVVRGLGMSLSSGIGMLGPIFIPLVNYLGSDMLILPLIIMGTMLIIGGMSSLLLPETLNRHLPQNLQDAELSGSDMLILPLIIMGTMLIIGGMSSLLLPETLNRHLPQNLQDAELTPLDCFAFCSIPQKNVENVSVFDSKL